LVNGGGNKEAQRRPLAARSKSAHGLFGNFAGKLHFDWSTNNIAAIEGHSSRSSFFVLEFNESLH
jgi:hypothetical protein